MKARPSTALITALAASVCCIGPLLAALAGAGSLASSFSWLEPLRPWLVGFTLLVLAFAWYQQLKPVRDDGCSCVPTKPSFWKGRTYLGIVTVMALLLLAFPYFSSLTTTVPSAAAQARTDLTHITIPVQGMTCAGCEEHITSAVSGLAGVGKVTASHAAASTEVWYDPHMATVEEIVATIDSTGYNATAP